MFDEKSCGAVVFTRTGDEIQYVLAQSPGGIYGFPKGHMEEGETERQTALREIFEEVGLTPTLLDGFRETEEYTLREKNGASKQVVYFLAEFSNQPIAFQEKELRAAPLVSYETAMQLLQHESSRRILTKAQQFLIK
ncbi:MAG: NUDIX domain-containing protein [Ruminococcaceae bacterium]|nr:NUDIX domain-containing protein [Oscillospiraceae bacterium]